MESIGNFLLSYLQAPSRRVGSSIISQHAKALQLATGSSDKRERMTAFPRVPKKSCLWRTFEDKRDNAGFFFLSWAMCHFYLISTSAEYQVSMSMLPLGEEGGARRESSLSLERELDTPPPQSKSINLCVTASVCE